MYITQFGLFQNTHECYVKKEIKLKTLRKMYFVQFVEFSILRSLFNFVNLEKIDVLNLQLFKRNTKKQPTQISSLV